MQNNSQTILVLAKDVLFVAVGCFLILRTGFLGTIVGALAVIWYGRDLWYRGKAWIGSKQPERDTVERPSGASRDESRSEDAPIIDDGKIQVTDLSGAKEVEFEKE
jgi:hypothetical protein